MSRAQTRVDQVAGPGASLNPETPGASLSIYSNDNNDDTNDNNDNNNNNNNDNNDNINDENNNISSCGARAARGRSVPAVSQPRFRRKGSPALFPKISWGCSFEALRP